MHKEKIKEIKQSVDVLTLSATPIPRTLQMSLLGIHNLSQIETAPLNRMPVQTYVMKKDKKIIQEIIERELGRNGQVFYLHNKTTDINSVAYQLEKKIPGAKVVVGHGKMDNETIENAIVRMDESLAAVEATNKSIKDILVVLETRQTNIDNLTQRIREIGEAIVTLQNLESTLNKLRG